MSTQNKSSDGLKVYYFSLKKFTLNSVVFMVPYFRRFLRFLALPYCYFKMVNWDECTASRYQVLKDFLYIFFTLKYFPDNYSLCRLWEKDRSQWCYYYGSIYDPYQRARLRKEVQKKEYEILFEDKYVCYQLCKAAGLPLPKQYGLITPKDDYKEIICKILNAEPSKKIIIKPLSGSGGKDIFVAAIVKNEIVLKQNIIEKSLGDFVLQELSVIQEFITQHEKLNNVAKSINTIRLVTMMTRDNDIILIGGLMRFGIGDSLLDNTSLGGVAIGIDLSEGKLLKYGYDFNSKNHLYHPSSKVLFKGFQIPLWDDVVSLSKKVQRAFPYYRMLGHDIAVSPSDPVLIEINAAHDNVGLEQSYGPILADKKVRQEFDKYNLLINKVSRV